MIVSQATWDKLFPKVAPIARKRRDYSSKKRRAKKVFRFRIVHRQTAGNNGPGRRHKRG